MKKAVLLLGPVILALLYFLHQAGSKEIALGDTLVAAKLPDLSGQERRIGQWGGKVLVVNFWATWCPPCRKEIPDFVAVEKKYRENGVQFVGIALDDAEKVRAFCRENHVSYPVLLDSAHKMQDFVTGIPYTLIIDGKGKIVDSHVGALSGEDLESKIRMIQKNT